MILLVVVEGPGDKDFFEHVLYEILQLRKVKVQAANGIDRMLGRMLPDVCELQDQYFKVIAIVDRDKMHEPFGKGRRSDRLQELLKIYPHFRAFLVRDNLEDLIRDCLHPPKKKEFNERLQRSKRAAAQWAIKQDLDVNILKNKTSDLEGYLRCQQQKEI